MVADSRVEADSLDNLFGVQSVSSGIGVQFVEVGYAHGEISIGKKFDCLRFGRVGKQGGDVLFDGTLFEQIGKGFGAF